MSYNIATDEQFIKYCLGYASQHSKFQLELIRLRIAYHLEQMKSVKTPEARQEKYETVSLLTRLFAHIHSGKLARDFLSN